METLDFLNKQSGTIVALANMVMAVGTVVLALGIPWSIRLATREEKDSFYATLDDTYFEIQKLIIEHPHLAQPDPAHKTAEQIVQYDAFAFTVWNFMESIVDYCRKDEFLSETWNCILRHESCVHAAWILREENRRKFKPSFLKMVDALGCLPDPGDWNM